MLQTMATPAQQGQQSQHDKGDNASIMRAMMPAQKRVKMPAQLTMPA
jgi:hypothetical protein